MSSICCNRRSRSLSKSFSNSRSYSGERRKSRCISRSPPRGRSISSERTHHSRLRRSITHRRKYSRSRSTSPLIRRSSHSRRRSTSRSRRTSPSPVRRRMRSPETYRSRPPIPRRSPTPIRHSHRSRSPPRYRSRSPVRHRYPSPLRRRSPSPVRRRYHRSPLTPSRRSPSPIRHRFPIHNRRRSPPPSRYRSHSQEALSSSPDRRLFPSPVKKRSPRSQRSPVRSPRERTRACEKSSPVRNARHRGSIKDSDEICEGSGSAVQWPSVSLRSPQRDTRVVGREAASSSPSPQKSQIHLKSPADSRRRSSSKDQRSPSPYNSLVMQSKELKVRDARASPPQNPRDQKHHHDSPEPMIKKEEFDRLRNNGNQKLKPSERCSISSKPDTHTDFEMTDGKHDYFEEKSVGHHSSKTRNRSDGLELGKEELESRSGKTSMKVLHPEDSDKGKVPAIYEDSQKADEKIRPLSDEAKHSKRLQKMDKPTVEVDEKSGSGSLNSGVDGSLKHRKRKDREYRKHRSVKKEVTSDDSSDSEIEDRKITKRRKEEEKRSRKEERRRRREERHHRREERHHRREERRAEKLQAKLIDGSAAEETVSELKKLEIELREKALESLRAKKGVGH